MAPKVSQLNGHGIGLQRVLVKSLSHGVNNGPIYNCQGLYGYKCMLYIYIETQVVSFISLKPSHTDSWLDYIVCYININMYRYWYMYMLSVITHGFTQLTGHDWSFQLDSLTDPAGRTHMSWRDVFRIKRRWWSVINHPEMGMATIPHTNMVNLGMDSDCSPPARWGLLDFTRVVLLLLLLG